METPYTTEDQLRCFITHPSTSPAILFNKEAVRNFYNQRIEDHALPSYYTSTWSSNQATKTLTKIPSTGMSTFLNPKETPLGTYENDEEMNLDKENYDSNGSDELEP